MSRWLIALGGGAVCVCCVLPTYEGVDTLPGDGGSGASGKGGTSNPGGSGGKPSSGGKSSSAGSNGEGAEGGVPGAGGDASLGGDGGSPMTTASAGGAAGMSGAENDGGSPSGGEGAGSAGSGGTASGTGGAGGSGAGGSGGAGGGGSGGSSSGNGCPVGVLGHCDVDAIYPTYPDYTLALVEDFPAALDLDTDPIFTWSDGAVTDSQTGFRKQNITFADGYMYLTAESACVASTINSQCYPPRSSYAEALSPNQTAQLGSMGVWSGELRTRYNNYRYGRYEAKLKAPIANPGQEGTNTLSGDYITTLFVFRSPKNVQWNQVNVELEPSHHDQVGGNVVNATSQVDYPAGNAAPFKTPVAAVPSYAITQEHVYAFNWTPSKIEWFVDGNLVHTFLGGGTVLIPNLSGKIMMNLWVFSGSAFGYGVNNHYPFAAAFDYFRFYRWVDEPTYPCPNPPACLPPADKTPSAQNNPNEVNYGQ